MKRIRTFVVLAATLALVGSQQAQAQTQTITLVSDTSWEVFNGDPASGPATSLGFAQKVCLNASAPANCPAGATLYGHGGGGWLANLSSIPGALWIWAPGITGATAPAELAEFFFVKEIMIKGTPTAGTIQVAADDLAEVRVNGTIVGTTGSATDVSLASAAPNSLKSFDITPHLTAGVNTITIRGQNGIGAFAGCTNCTYSQHPAGVVFGASITFVDVLDHFKCYKTKQPGTKFDPRQVVLADQFNTQRVNVVRPETFCNPVDKDGSGINNPTGHLTCYKIRDVRGDEFPKFRKQRVEASDQFGTHTLLLKKIRTLCLPSSKSPAGEVPGPPPTGLDHFKCYKTKQLGTRFDPRRVILTDQFSKERVNVVRPEAFCTPVDKDGSGISDPTAHLTCYKIRDVRGDEFPKFRKRPVEVGDQFGTHSLLVKKTRTLCLPSSKTVL
jgi:hypothetical protein